MTRQLAEFKDQLRSIKDISVGEMGSCLGCIKFRIGGGGIISKVF